MKPTDGHEESPSPLEKNALHSPNEPSARRYFAIEVRLIAGTGVEVKSERGANSYQFYLQSMESRCYPCGQRSLRHTRSAVMIRCLIGACVLILAAQSPVRADDDLLELTIWKVDVKDGRLAPTSYKEIKKLADDKVAKV